MAKETRTQFIPPPPPIEDLKSVVQWAKHMTVLLPTFLNSLQRMMNETYAQTYDIGVPVAGDQVVKELEFHIDITESAGEI